MTGYIPGSLAVALAYEAPGAPRVVAKGDGELGRRIIETTIAISDAAIRRGLAALRAALRASSPMPLAPI